MCGMRERELEKAEAGQIENGPIDNGWEELREYVILWDEQVKA